MATRTLEQVLSAELKRRREAAGVRQETVALAAQSYGLDWGQATVSALEAGRRDLTFGEILLLPLILYLAKVTPTVIRTMDLIPKTDEMVILAGKSSMTLRGARTLAGSVPMRKLPTLQLPKPRLVTEAERKAARKLRTAPKTIASLAYSLWRHGLAQERDRRIGDAATQLSPRSLQAVRGRITRTLTQELEPLVQILMKKKEPPHG